MGTLEKVLIEMGEEIPGFMAAAVVGMDGVALAKHSTNELDLDYISGKFTKPMRFIKNKMKQYLQTASIEEVITTQNSYAVCRFLVSHSYWLGILIDRKQGNLGSLQLVCEQFDERIYKAIPKAFVNA